MTDELRNTPLESKPDDLNFEARKYMADHPQREADRKAADDLRSKVQAEKAAEAAEAQKTADAKKAAEAKKDEPIVHGEGAQRFANKNATHSERVLHGNVVTPPVRKERYEHPERNQ